MNNAILVQETVDNGNIAKTYGAPEEFNLPKPSNNIVDVEYTIESTGKELVAANDNMFPTFPSDPNALPAFITVATKAVEAETKLLNGLLMTPGKYQLALAQTQEHAALLLRAQLCLADLLKGIKTQQGMRTDLKSKANKLIKSKKEIIAKDYNLTVRQARDIEKLTKECVEAAIKEALENNEIPTRALALSKLGKKDKEDRGNVDFIPVMEDDHKTLTLKEPLYYTSLFANVGIGTYYLNNMGIKCAVANELLEERAKWHEEIYPDCEMVQGSFTDEEVFNKLVRLHKEKGCKIFLASPPCQTFSRANTATSKSTDKRTILFETTLEFARQTDNDYILIENVPDFLNAKPKNAEHILKGKTVGEYIKEELEKLGYIVNIGIFSAADYGTAQDRQRSLILASKKELGIWKFPKKDKFRKVLFEAIGDLPSLEPGEKDRTRPFHYAPELPACQINFLKHTPTAHSAWENSKAFRPVNVDGKESGAKFKSSFSRKDWNKPCNTITTDSGSIGGMINIHPGRPLSNGCYSDCRPLSILELFRVTGLPDDYPVPEWAANNDRLIREVIGECFAPLHVARLMTTLPMI